MSDDLMKDVAPYLSPPVNRELTCAESSAAEEASLSYAIVLVQSFAADDAE